METLSVFCFITLQDLYNSTGTFQKGSDVREHTAVKVARCVPGRGGRGNPPLLFDNLGSLPAKSLTRYYASLFLPDQTMKREKKVWSGLDGNFSPGDPFPVIRDKIKEEAATEIRCSVQYASR